MASTPKSKRCYHRVMSGLEKGGDFRFLTLTSSTLSPDTCQRSWRCLYMRLHRRGLIRSYIKVPEPSKNGKQHLHVVIEGDYIAQAMIAELWRKIHRAGVVDIRRVKRGQGKNGLAMDMAKYMAKKSAYRYSWSWSWVWKGFCKDWKALKRLWHYQNSLAEPTDFQGLLRMWRHFLHQKKPRFIRLFLEEWPVPKDYSILD